MLVCCSNERCQLNSTRTLYGFYSKCNILFSVLKIPVKCKAAESNTDVDCFLLLFIQHRISTFLQILTGKNRVHTNGYKKHDSHLTKTTIRCAHHLGTLKL